jgi:hypothetical protein
METAYFSETMVSTYESIWPHNLEQQRHLHHCENLKSHVVSQNNNICMLMMAFWLVTPSGLMGGYQHFGGTYFLHLQGE